MPRSPRRIALETTAKEIGLKGYSKLKIAELESAIDQATNRTAALDELNDIEESEFLASALADSAAGNVKDLGDFTQFASAPEFVESFNNEFAERVISATEKAVADLSGFGQEFQNRSARRAARKDMRLRNDGMRKGSRKSY